MFLSYIVFRIECGALTKAYSIKDANNYICIGGKPKEHPSGGVAMKGTVCEMRAESRIAFVQYVVMAGDTGMNLTAAQMTSHTAAVIQQTYFRIRFSFFPLYLGLFEFLYI